jgi:hypothetical protein
MSALRTYVRCIIFPASEVEGGLLLILVLVVEVRAKFLRHVSHRPAEGRRVYLAHILCVHTHAVIRLDAFSTKVDGCSGPVHIVMIDRNQNNIFAEDIELERVRLRSIKLQRSRTFFVHFANRPAL